MNKLKVRKGDRVKIITGKNKGKVGDILKVLPAENKVIIAGVNLAKKHMKPTKESEGGIVQKELPIAVSNISHVDPKTGEATKIGYKFLEDGKKVRFAKKSGEIITNKAGGK